MKSLRFCITPPLLFWSSWNVWRHKNISLVQGQTVQSKVQTVTDQTGQLFLHPIYVPRRLIKVRHWVHTPKVHSDVFIFIISQKKIGRMCTELIVQNQKWLTHVYQNAYSMRSKMKQNVSKWVKINYYWQRIIVGSCDTWIFRDNKKAKEEKMVNYRDKTCQSASRQHNWSFCVICGHLRKFKITAKNCALNK